jgi:hypothetical protein
MPPNYARTRASDLRFHLYERSIHPELFEVLRRAEVIEGAYRAVLQITGQSHILTVRTEGETITEVLAPPEAPLPRAGIRSSVQLARHARDEVVRTGGALHYRGSFRVETYAPAEFRERAARILASDSFERIKVFFDDEPFDRRGAESGSAELAPFALMDFRHKGRRLDVVSVHAYPHELTIVQVETRVEAAPFAT